MRARSWIGLGCAAALAACSARVGPTEGGAATLVFPARYEATDGGAPPESTAGRSSGGPQASPPPSLPDPEPLRTATQWVYRLRYHRGDIRVQGVARRDLDEPRVTARRVGRYAIELWIGHELVDRVRFDFPLLAAEPPPSGPRQPLHQPPSLGAGADSTIDVWVPGSPRATRAVLVDRATGESRALPWPPDEPIEPAPTAMGPDGGAR